MTELVAEPLSQVRPEPIRWLWDRYLPRGKLALLDGDPGVGKSLIAIDLAARLSRGSPLPDGSPSGRAHTTLLLAAEDAAADTTRPRAEAAGADLERIIAVSGKNGVPLQFPNDLNNLETLVHQHKPDLIVIDPIVAFLPASIVATSDQCVRRVLALLSLMAERSDCAILMNRHLRKAGSAKALYRGSGSIGFIASARTGLYASKHPSEPDLGVLALAKSNLARAAPSLGYRLKTSESGLPIVEWMGPVSMDANELGERPAADLRPRDRASFWLQEQLAGGPRKAVDLYSSAAEAGIPERTLRRAKADLRLGSKVVHHSGGEKESFWFDHEAPWPKNAPFKKPLELPPLPDLEDSM